ncbi:hypothetical protein LCGC14_3149460 [marine sediment metagenome]|uniref:Uncharacterized protein n=1 Tax=marine sediment metagenome TaxID=412755 RepID=A0A0F8YIW0_9ZZZZ
MNQLTTNAAIGQWFVKKRVISRAGRGLILCDDNNHWDVDIVSSGWRVQLLGKCEGHQEEPKP